MGCDVYSSSGAESEQGRWVVVYERKSDKIAPIW